MLRSSMREWHNRDGFAGRGLNTSSVDLIYKKSELIKAVDMYLTNMFVCVV